MRVPGLASDEDLAGVHDAAGQAGSVDGAQGGAQLDDVGPDQGLWEQAGVLPGRRRFVLTYKKARTCTGFNDRRKGLPPPPSPPVPHWNTQFKTTAGEGKCPLWSGRIYVHKGVLLV